MGKQTKASILKIPLGSTLYGKNGARWAAEFLNNQLHDDDKRFNRAVFVTGRGFSTFAENAFAEFFEIYVDREKTEVGSYLIVFVRDQSPMVFDLEHDGIRVIQYQRPVPIGTISWER